MGGLNWEALPIVVDMLGITDVNGLIVQLVTLRNLDKEGKLPNGTRNTDS